MKATVRHYNNSDYSHNKVGDGKKKEIKAQNKAFQGS